MSRAIEREENTSTMWRLEKRYQPIVYEVARILTDKDGLLSDGKFTIAQEGIEDVDYLNIKWQGKTSALAAITKLEVMTNSIKNRMNSPLEMKESDITLTGIAAAINLYFHDLKKGLSESFGFQQLAVPLPTGQRRSPGSDK